MTEPIIGLAGATGFVGTTLQKQVKVTHCFDRKSFGQSDLTEYDLFVCSAAPAQKWIANREPEKDRENLANMTKQLLKIRCRKMILISTVDVFTDPNGATESCTPTEDGLSGYGLHRLMLENEVKRNFDNPLIVRLAGLVGPGLRKNVIYDFRHNNNLDQIDARGVFQFYPMVQLWRDILKADEAGLSVVHLTAEPVSVAEVAKSGFGFEFSNELDKPVAHYDFQTEYATQLGGQGVYTYSKRESLLAIRAYAQG